MQTELRHLRIAALVSGRRRAARVPRALAVLVLLGTLFGAHSSEATPNATTPTTTAPQSGNTVEPGSLSGALTWQPPSFGSAVGSTHDLCVDAEAIAAGLDGGALEEDRRNLGIDCADPASPMRYGFLTDSGVLTLGASTREAESNAQHLTSEDGTPGGLDRPEVLLGAYPYVGADTSAGFDDIDIIPGSMSLIDGTLRGLIHNHSASRSAVAVQVGTNHTTWALPFTLQPGESAPFEIDDWPAADMPDGSAIRIEFTMTPVADLGRALLVEGAPGNWHGTAADFPGFRNILASVPEGEFRFFESIVEVVSPAAASPNESPAGAVPIVGCHVLVTFLNADGGVFDVAEVPLFEIVDDGMAVRQTDRAAPGDLYAVGFVIPDDANDFLISMGGTP